jgi:hypothetical protein
MLEGGRPLTAFAYLQGGALNHLGIVQKSQLAPLANKRNKRRV